MEQAPQRDCGCPFPANIWGQVGQGSKQPDRVEDVLVHCRKVGLDNLRSSQAILWLYENKSDQ